MLHLANVTPSGVTSPYIIYYNIEDDARVVFDPFFGKASWRRQHASRRLSKANFSQQAISWIEIVSRLNQVISSKLINLIEIISKFAQTSNTPKFDWSCSHNSSYKVFVFFSPNEVFRKLSRLSFKDWCFTCSPGFLHHPLSWLWIPETKLSKIHFVSSFLWTFYEDILEHAFKVSALFEMRFCGQVLGIFPSIKIWGWTTVQYFIVSSFWLQWFADHNCQQKVTNVFSSRDRVTGKGNLKCSETCKNWEKCRKTWRREMSRLGQFFPTTSLFLLH